MWLEQGDLHRAHTWLSAAHRRLPGYAPAQGHLAEVEAALGEPDSAIARLRPLTISSDDPDYAAQLARIMSEVGRVEEALDVARPSGGALRRTGRAASRGLRRPRGGILARSRRRSQIGRGWLAQKNLEVRQTPRAHELLTRAALASDGAQAIHPARHRTSHDLARPSPRPISGERRAMDVIVIGAGPAGVFAAYRAAELGAKTTLITRDEFGGMGAN